MLLLVTTAFLLIAVTIFIHGYGTTIWLRFVLVHYSFSDGKLKPKKTFGVIVATALVLIALHMIEILVWALAYLTLVPSSELPTVESALYFSAVTFTTLGYGDITLTAEWRLMSGFEAIDGILLMGWTTAFLFSVLQRAWNNPGDKNELPE
jgi:voltage-gated potassium channel